MLRQFFIIYFFLLVLLVGVMGFRGCKSSRTPIEIFPDMDRQNKLLEQAESPFFADGRADRPKVPGTVPYITEMEATYPNLTPTTAFVEDDYLATGKLEDGSFGDGLPIEVDAQAMEEGQQLFNTFCYMCHGFSGDGNGVLKNPRYGFATIADLTQTRLVDMPDGEIYNTIAWGKNTMMPYGEKLRIEERWKVVLYVRALQRAAHSTIEDVPTEHRRDLGL